MFPFTVPILAEGSPRTVTPVLDEVVVLKPSMVTLPFTVSAEKAASAGSDARTLPFTVSSLMPSVKPTKDAVMFPFVVSAPSPPAAPSIEMLPLLVSRFTI